MKLAVSAVLLLGIIKYTVAAGEESDNETAMVNGSYILNKDNFDNVMKNEPHFIVYAYVPWCGHCKAFAPIWAELAEQINTDPDYETKVYSANIEDNPIIHNDWHTTSFPTIYYVRKGEHKRYSEPRDQETLLKYIIRNEMDNVINIKPDELEDAVQSAEVAVVGTFVSGDKVEMFERLAWVMEVSTFFRVELEEGEGTTDQITVYSQHEGKPRKRIISDLSDESAVKVLIAKYRRPYVIPFTRDTHVLAFEIPDRTISVLLFHDKDPEYEQRLEQFGKVARVYSELYTFVEMRMDRDYVRKFTGYFNIKTSDLPIAFLINTDQEAGSKMTKTSDLTESGLAQMIEDYRQGTAPTYHPNSSGGEAEEDLLPEDWNDRNVKYLTAENYLEVVLSPAHDVFVMWYRDSCPHCQAMEPVWEELAVKYKEHPTLQLAHIKSTNGAGIPNFKIEKVPTMLLYKQDATDVAQGVEWEGKERSLEGLDEFLVENVFNVVEKDEL